MLRLARGAPRQARGGIQAPLWGDIPVKRRRIPSATGMVSDAIGKKKFELSSDGTVLTLRFRFRLFYLATFYFNRVWDTTILWI